MERMLSYFVRLSQFFKNLFYDHFDLGIRNQRGDMWY